MLKRTLPLAFMFLNLPVSGSAFDLVDDLLAIAQSAPWSIELVEDDVQALAIEPLNASSMGKIIEPIGFEDDHYWSVSNDLTVPFGDSGARGLLDCSRIGRKGWEIVLEQERQPFPPFSESRAYFFGHFADDPHPFPDDAFLHLECIAALSPLDSMTAEEVEEFLTISERRLQKQFTAVVTGQILSTGFFAPSYADGIIATGGQDSKGYRLDKANIYIDANGTINFRFSAWATFISH